MEDLSNLHGLDAVEGITTGGGSAIGDCSKMKKTADSIGGTKVLQWCAN